MYACINVGVFLISIGLMIPPLAVQATRKCAWVRGIVRCNRDPSKQMNVEVRLYDRDGIGPLKVFDPDDLMGITFTDHEGSFQLDGCGDDFNWIPGISNLPDPFVRIHHQCNNNQGEILDLPGFHVFVPETHDVGIVQLDNTLGLNSPVDTHNNKARESPSESKKLNEMYMSPSLVVPSLQIDDGSKDKEKYDVKHGEVAANSAEDGDLLMEKLKKATASGDTVELRLDSDDSVNINR